MTWITRDIEQHLTVLSQEAPVTLLTGPHQSGKTALLQQHFSGLPYVSLDSPHLAEEAEESGDLFLQKLGKPAVIDEVQYAPKLFRYLKVDVDRQRHRCPQFILTGSQRFSMMVGVSDSLAGRIRIIELTSLSHRELEGYVGRPSEGMQLLQWILQGGYPELHLRPQKPERYYQSYIAAYLERDVRQLIEIRNLRDFDRFLRLLSLQTGQLLALPALASQVGVSVATIKRWLDVLLASHIVTLVEPWFSNLNKRIVKTPKIYFLDTGLCCYLAGFRTIADLQQSPLLGAVFETLTLGQIWRAYSNSFRPPIIYFFRDQDGHEVDFVLRHPSGGYHLLEVKWSETAKFKRENFAAFAQHCSPQTVLQHSIVTSLRGRFFKESQQVTRRDSIDWDDL